MTDAQMGLVVATPAIIVMALLLYRMGVLQKGGVAAAIMMSLAMVVVASMVGVGGLGKNVLQAINNQFFTVGFLNGFALVAIAIIFDRTSQAYGRRLQKHSEVIHG